MKKYLIFLISFSALSIFFAQQLTRVGYQEILDLSKQSILLSQEDLISIPIELESKILSGKLIQNLSEKIYLYERGLLSKEKANELVVIYMTDYPTVENIASLNNLNVECFLNVWTPPLKNHPYGFFIARMPVDKLSETMALNFIKKIDTGEYENFPHNNAGGIAINADDVWADGYDGTGVKVGVLDSGIDTYYDGTEFPASFERMDYSSFPTIDPNVENITSGHGTHVTGTVLARGINSIGRSDEGNGTTPFKGSAPDANLTFLKIGGDASSSASSTAMIAAMDAAVNIYDVDVLSMSYGGWYAHHDGSSATEQKVDWVYSQGVPFFLSAGNSAADGQHYSGTVAAVSSTSFIAINASSGTGLSFNLVWDDGLGTHNDLFLEFYNPSQVKYTTNVTQNLTTESIRGTESKYAWYDFTVAAGTYYIKVVNNSPNSQFYHIYFHRLTTPLLSFASPDPFYTIGQPASADDGFAVGSYVSRDLWIASDGSGPYWYGSSFILEGIAPYSSRGPRVNGGVVKPDITAPGSAIISVRDTDVLTSPNSGWIDNDGTTGAGNANYYVMTGTSMACPIAAGAGALLLDKTPGATPQQIYDAIQNSASMSGTGFVPNDTWGYGKLDAFAASNETPFPVELNGFTAKVVDNSISLKWQTATEIDNYGFEIERSANSITWQSIGFVEGFGNSNSPKEYSFVDSKISSGTYHYRLKQIDNDGTFEYSNVIEVNFSSPQKFELTQNYPNPFNPLTNIQFTLPNEAKVKLKVLNVLGESAITIVSDQLTAGLHNYEFDATQFPSGIYFYSLEVDGKILETKKMILLK
jgi:subtilisin family serine protease